MNEHEMRIIREMSRTVRDEQALPPQYEALGYLFGERLGLMDSIGGAEWRRRVEEGIVSADVVRALESLEHATA